MRLPNGATLPKGMSLPVASFRLQPEPGTRFVRVMVWPTRRSFHGYVRDSGRAIGARTNGTCSDVRRWRFRGGRSRRDPAVAEVNLILRHLGMEVVTHELFHATIAWGRRIGFDWQRFGADDSVNADEERLTYVHGRLCRDFVRAAEEVGLYDPARWKKS